MPAHHHHGDDRPFSQVLADIGVKDDPKLPLGELVNAFGERSFGALMLFLGILSIVVGAVPGTTTILGAPLLLISLQLMIRQDQLWLPRWALRGSIDRSTYRTATAKVLPAIRKVERLSRPRLSIMTSDLAEMLIGVACALLACILVLPIWGGNLVPALIIAVFGFGLMQRDGYAVLVGWVGFLAGVALVVLAWATILPLAQNAFAWIGRLF